MTDNRGNGGWSGTAGSPKDGFQASHRPGKEKIS
jgi:hypothetical protein